MKPCLLIPIYNHGSTIGEVVQSLERFGLPCLVVNDGSDRQTREALDEVERRHDWIEVAHRSRNGGRGVALRTGYRLAARRGMSHVIQLDADGQHDPNDIPRFLDTIAANPDAMILGRPKFDASIPAVRYYGRMLSQGLVWLETLSFAIEDPLCGFRAFPLVPIVELIDEMDLGDRMDFDPELVVRLRRRGVDVRSLPTQVIYPEGGLSNFDLVRDNARMVSLHLRLLAGGALGGAWRRADRTGGATG